MCRRTSTRIYARAATRIEDDNVGIGKAIGKVQFFAEDCIDTGNLILDDFGRGEPNPQFLSQFRIEGFQEWLVEVLNGMFVLEFLKKRGALDTV